MFYWINRVGNDYDVECSINLNSLVDPASNCKSFCLSQCYVDSVMNSFSLGFIRMFLKILSSLWRWASLLSLSLQFARWKEYN